MLIDFLIFTALLIASMSFVFLLFLARFSLKMADRLKTLETAFSELVDGLEELIDDVENVKNFVNKVNKMLPKQDPDLVEIDTPQLAYDPRFLKPKN